MQSRAIFVPSLHNAAPKYNPSPNLENIFGPAVVFSIMPFWISIQSDLTAQLIKTSVLTELLTRSQVIFYLFSWSHCNSLESGFAVIKLIYVDFGGVGHFFGAEWALRRVVYSVKYWYPICCYGKHFLFIKTKPKGAHCIHKPIALEYQWRLKILYVLWGGFEPEKAIMLLNGLLSSTGIIHNFSSGSVGCSVH